MEKSKQIKTQQPYIGRAKKRGRKEYLNFEETKRLLEVVDREDVYIAILLSINESFRVSEVAGLKPENFIFRQVRKNNEVLQKIYIRFFDGKKNKVREVPLDNSITGEVRRYLAKHEKDKKLFGFGTSPTALNRKLRKYCSKIGIKAHSNDEWVSWHMLRRTFVWQSKLSNRDVSFVAFMTGDSPTTIYKFYQKMGAEEAIEEMERFPKP